MESKRSARGGCQVWELYEGAAMYGMATPLCGPLGRACARIVDCRGGVPRRPGGNRRRGVSPPPRASILRERSAACGKLAARWRRAMDS